MYFVVLAFRPRRHALSECPDPRCSWHGFEFLPLVIEAHHARTRHGRLMAPWAALMTAWASCPSSTTPVWPANSALPPSTNVSTAAGHVGRDGHHAEAAGLGNDLGFTLVELGVEHDVPSHLCACRIEESSSDFSIEVVPTSTGCFCSLQPGDLIGDRQSIFPWPCGRHYVQDFPGAASILLVGMTTISSL